MHDAQKRRGARLSGIIPKIAFRRYRCKRPDYFVKRDKWSATGGRSELSDHALDDCHEGDPGTAGSGGRLFLHGGFSRKVSTQPSKSDGLLAP